MKFTRVIVAIVIALILIAGVWIFTQMRGGDADEAAIEMLDTEVIDADEQVQTSKVVRVAGYDVRLNPDPNQVTVLASLRTVPTVVPPATITPNVQVATNTPPSNPTTQSTVATSSTDPTPVPVVTNHNGIAFVQHTVQQGETLYAIAQRYNTSVSLMAEYNIAQDHIYPGNVVTVPIAATTACAAGQRSHVVLEGENVFRIAIRYGTTKEAIRAANPVINENYLIYVGDVICIP